MIYRINPQIDNTAELHNIMSYNLNAQEHRLLSNKVQYILLHLITQRLCAGTNPLYNLTLQIKLETASEIILNCIRQCETTLQLRIGNYYYYTNVFDAVNKQCIVQIVGHDSNYIIKIVYNHSVRSVDIQTNLMVQPQSTITKINEYITKLNLTRNPIPILLNSI